MPVSFSAPQNRDARARGAGVTAVLGPTNTGKTHLAIERMLAHSSGMIGLPLRLLAREVYNKVVDKVGASAVALVTGEEKIKPANPRFWVSTVEAMPRDIDVAFLAIDEVQLGSDLERGHVFTDRMLNRRGREETLVLGAATVRPMVERLLPGAHILSRPRLSQLTFAGDKKLTRLQRRSAIVAFSSDEVYAIAELMRRQRGGAAVVLGALSPRTRNAQVALYQSGDVDYLIATDAIGMGLNLDVEHVAFASDRKFDGYQFRRLNPAEFAQIAGRAGRATHDGTFGTTGRCPPFDNELVQALECHTFEPLKVMQWRNTALDFSSIGALSASLAQTPKEEGLTRAPIGEDILVLEHAARDEDVRALTKTPAAVERLWEVCQIPDYRKISPASHAEMVTTLYSFLMREGRISADWYARQVSQADRTDGDIDTLSTRIAHIRTWTFVANRPDWLADPDYWQDATRAVEDKLSDALHERLTERFVDRRTSVLMRRLRENTMLETEISKTGDVMVEGHLIGRLNGFQFAADPSAGGSEAKTLRGAAQKALAGEIDQRAARLANAADSQFVLAGDGTIRWLGEPVGKLIAGEEVLKPRVRVIADEHLTGSPQESVQARLDQWLKAHIEKLLGPLSALAAAEDVTGIARGIAFQLVEALGVIERHRVADDVKTVDQAARATLRKYGVRFGAYHLYMPALLKPGPRTLALQLWALKQNEPELKGLDEVSGLASSGRTSFAAGNDVHKALYRTLGYRVCGARAVRVDILERLADLIRPAIAWRQSSPGGKPAGAIEGGGFTVTPAMTSLVGSSGEDFASILRSLGYRMERRPKPAEPAPASDAAINPEEGAGQAAIPATDAPPTADMAVADRSTGPEATRGEAATTRALENAHVPQALPQEMPQDLPEIREAPSAVSDQGEALPDVLPSGDERQSPPENNSAEESGTPAPAAAKSDDAPQAASEPATEAAKTDEPALIEVWRPGRSEERRPQHRRPREPRRDAQSRTPSVASTPDQTQAQDQGATPAEAAAAQAAVPVGEPASAERPERAPRHRHRRERQTDRADSPERADGPRRTGRPDRPDRQRNERGDRPRHERHDRPSRHDRPKPYALQAQEAQRERRDKAPDPNSPFAKLAALKEQLEANAKQRS